MEEQNLNNQIPEKTNSKTTKMIAFVVGLIILILLGWLIVMNLNKTNTKKNSQTINSSKISAADEEEEYLGKSKYEAEVTIDKNGFTPSTLVVKSDTKVIFTNKDSSVHKIVVTPGSKTTKYWGSNDIEGGNLYDARFIDKGEYRYFDGDNPTATGLIMVKWKKLILN